MSKYSLTMMLFAFIGIISMSSESVLAASRLHLPAEVLQQFTDFQETVQKEISALQSIVGNQGHQLNNQARQLEKAFSEIDRLTNQVAHLEVKLLAQDKHQENGINSKVNSRPISLILTREESSLTIDQDARVVYYPRSCFELRLVDPSMPSGSYYIDPDGPGVGDAPFLAICDMTTGSTSIGHDQEERITVNPCSTPGCYSVDVTYRTTQRQMSALAALSTSCSQKFRYECTEAPFELSGTQYSFWNDRYGSPQYFWSGFASSQHTCQCGIDGNCIDRTKKCNCDAMLPGLVNDDGVLTEKALLPVAKLNFGGVKQKGVHSLGKFECNGSQGVRGKPTSCRDLYQIGHFLNGFYHVKGNSSDKIDVVYCDFSVPAPTPEFEHRIGYTDVKTYPGAYFYVQKSGIPDLTYPVGVLKWDVERLNVGGFMNLATGVFTVPVDGIYYFSLSGLKCANPNFSYFFIRVNEQGIASGMATNINSYNQYTATSTLRLKKGDRVDAYARDTCGYDDQNHHVTHFNGILLEEFLNL